MSEIWELAHFNNGGFTHHEIWELPISIRRFYLKKTHEFIKSKKEAMDKENNIITENTKVSDIPRINIPDHLVPKEKDPTYIVKSKKQ